MADTTDECSCDGSEKPSLTVSDTEMEKILSRFNSQDGDRILVFEGHEVLKIAHILKAGNEGAKLQILESLANSSRQEPQRQELGRSGLLEICARGFHTSESHDTLKQRLRLIGNCCADNDINRDIVIEADIFDRLAILMHESSSLKSISAIVMFNFINDYERSQKYALSHGLIVTLASTLDDTTSPKEYGIKCLELGLQYEEQVATAPDSLIDTILRLGNDDMTAWDSFQSLLTCFTALISDDAKRRYIIVSNLGDQCLSLMTRLEIWDGAISSNSVADVDEEDREDALKFLQSTSGLIVSAMSDMSASDIFLDFYPVRSGFQNRIIQWLKVQSTSKLTCAAIVLGNIARSPDVCEILMTEYRTHQSLVQILESQIQIGVLHAAGGALKNLVIGAPLFKDEILGLGVLGSLKKFYRVRVMVEVQMMGLSLARILLASSLPNVRRLITSAAGPSHMEDILDVYKENSEILVRIEIGRIVASVLREVSKCPENNPQREALQDASLTFYSGFIPPLVDMITQEKWPVVRSEGWFALALLTQPRSGADALTESKLPLKFYRELMKTLRGSSDTRIAEGGRDPISTNPSHQAVEPSHLEKDRNNVLILISGFLKGTASKAHEEKAKVFKLIQNGEKLDDNDFIRLLNLENENEE